MQKYREQTDSCQRGRCGEMGKMGAEEMEVQASISGMNKSQEYKAQHKKHTP